LKRWAKHGRARRAIASAMFAIGLAPVLAPPPASAATGSPGGWAIREFVVRTQGSGPFGVAAGPGGTLWFTESYADRIGVLGQTAAVREIALPAGSEPEQIVRGPDGNFWVTLFHANSIARLTPSGDLTEIAIPTQDSGPFDITNGPDGNLWFTESRANTIGRVTPNGAITEFLLDPFFNVEGITAGPDGALWFTRFSNPEFPYPGFIGRITPDGSWREVPSDGVGDPLGIATGPDGNLWVTGPANDVVARVTTSFGITPYKVPGGVLNVPYLITAGPDGAMWFTENGVSEAPGNVGGNKIGRITMAGGIRQFDVPTASSEPSGIAVGPDGRVWFAEQATDRLGQLVGT